MPYSLSTVHDLLGGTGSISVASPAGLLLEPFSIPAFVGADPGTPTFYRGLGHVTPANAHGWFPNVPIHYAKQLVYPLASPTTLVGYDLVVGMGLKITELVEAAMPNSLSMPWDRNLAAWTRFTQPALGSSLGVTTSWTYTVPAGRKLWLSAANVRHDCNGVSSSLQYLVGLIRQGSYPIVQAGEYGNAIGPGSHHELNPGTLVLASGDTITAEYFGSMTGGSHVITLAASGFLFDA